MKDAEVEAKAEEEAKAAWEEERQKLLAMRAARVVPKGLSKHGLCCLSRFPLMSSLPSGPSQ